LSNKIESPQLQDYDFLSEMYHDGYFPDFLVDKVKQILVELCQEIEAQPPSDRELLLRLTHAATERINDLQEELSEEGSEIETVAREAIAADFEKILRAYGFADIDVEDAIAPRDW